MVERGSVLILPLELTVRKLREHVVRPVTNYITSADVG
jgi:hypothetical protein